MDAVPMTLGQDAGAWARQVELGLARLRDTMPRLLPLAQGGTTVGTGLAFAPNPDKFEGIGAHGALVELSGALNTLAVRSTRSPTT